MMRMFYILMTSLLLAITSVYADPAMTETDATIVKTAISAFMLKNQIPGVAVEIYHDGQAQSYYFGYANQEKKTAVSKNTIFEIGSITKLMTSYLLAQQLDMSKVKLDQSVTEYIPNLSTDFEDITLGNLATHTAGLAKSLPETIQTSVALKTYLKSAKPLYGADEEWLYSNVGMGLLGEALENMTRQSLEQLYQNQIKKPLHMDVLTLIVPKKSMKWYAHGYDNEGHMVAPSAPGLLPGTDSLKASADAMQRFLAAAIGLQGTLETVLYPMRMTQSAYVSLADRKQGLGWEIHSLEANKINALLSPPTVSQLGPIPVQEIYEIAKFDGNSLLDKTGASHGFRAYIAIIPNKQSGIVILANRQVLNNAIVKTGREILFKLVKIEAQHEAEDDDATD